MATRPGPVDVGLWVGAIVGLVRIRYRLGLGGLGLARGDRAQHVAELVHRGLCRSIDHGGRRLPHEPSAKNKICKTYLFGGHGYIHHRRSALKAASLWHLCTRTVLISHCGAPVHGSIWSCTKIRCFTTMRKVTFSFSLTG